MVQNSWCHTIPYHTNVNHIHPVTCAGTVSNDAQQVRLSRRFGGTGTLLGCRPFFLRKKKMQRRSDLAPQYYPII